MFVRSPLCTLDQQSRALLSLGHRARHGDGLRDADAGGDGLRLRDHRARAEAAADRPALGVGRLLARASPAPRWPRPRSRSGKASVLYTFYPPMIAQPVLLPRRRAGGGRLVDLGGADGASTCMPGSATTRARRCRSRCTATWRAPTSGPGRRSAPRSRSCCRSCRPRSGFTDTIDAGLARVFFSWTLHAIVYFWLMPAYIAFYTIVPRAIGVAPVQRHDGPRRVRAVPRVLDADRHPPPVRRSAGRRRLQVRARGDDGDGVGADLADRVHDRRLGGDRRRACAAARARSAG